MSIRFLDIVSFLAGQAAALIVHFALFVGLPAILVVVAYLVLFIIAVVTGGDPGSPHIYEEKENY